MTKPIASLALGALLSTTVLAGCGGTSAPTETTASASAPATTSATPSAAPKIPTAATKRTPEGAVAFVKYWFDLANYARMNPAKGIRDKYNAPECKWCKSDDRIIGKLIDAQARLIHPALKATQFKNVAPIRNVGYTMSMVLVQARTPAKGADGTTLAKTPASKTPYITNVAWVDNGWKMFLIEVVQP